MDVVLPQVPVRPALDVVDYNTVDTNTSSQRQRKSRGVQTGSRLLAYLLGLRMSNLTEGLVDAVRTDASIVRHVVAGVAAFCFQIRVELRCVPPFLSFGWFLRGRDPRTQSEEVCRRYSRR